MGAFEELQKKIGYRFVLKRFEHPAWVRAGQTAAVKMWWFNAGVSGVYKDYDLALEIGGVVSRLQADVRGVAAGGFGLGRPGVCGRELEAGEAPGAGGAAGPAHRKAGDSVGDCGSRGGMDGIGWGRWRFDRWGGG